jgi:hypothetical protein
VLLERSGPRTLDTPRLRSLWGNMLPAAAICVTSLSLIDHDGLAELIGVILATLAVLLVWGAIVTLVRKSQTVAQCRNE